MEDFRFLEDNSLWIIAIVVFLIVLYASKDSCGCFNLDCLVSNFLSHFNGLSCGCNSTWIYIVIAVAAYFIVTKTDLGCGIFRNALQ